MTENRVRNEKLFEEAFNLIILMHSNPHNQAIIADARRWRAMSSEHQAVWTGAMELHQLSGQLTPETSPHGATRFSRRQLITGGAVALAAAVTGVTIAPNLLLPFRADHSTHTGQLQSLQLPDGSQITLGPDSAITTQFEAGQRQVSLLAGMAWFSVNPGLQTPLKVSHNQQQVVASAGAFTLSQDAGFFSVAVEQGNVTVNDSHRLYSGQWLSIGDNGNTTTGLQAVEQMAAWRHGTLVAENETVAVVVAKIARWLPGKVVIASDWLRHQRISGAFNLTQPRQALDAVVLPLQANIHHLTPWLTVLNGK